MDNLLWTDKPVIPDAETTANHKEEWRLWEREVYPIGNGRLGCTAFGAPGRERIQFNQDSLWVGNEDNTGGYQPFGDIYVVTGHSTYTDYRRQLDIEHAVQTITYQSNGVQYKRRYFASHPAQLLVLHFSADRAGACSGRIHMGNIHDIPTTVEERDLVMRGDTGCLWFWRKILAEPSRLIADRAYASNKNIDLDFEARCRLLHTGGSCRAEGNELIFENCDSITLLLGAETNYLADRSKGWRGEPPHDKVAALIAAAAEKDVGDLLEEHIADYQTVFSRMTMDLGSTPGELQNLSTPARLKAYQERDAAGETPLDRGLESLFYQYARYLMICSSRPGHGALPANLQGIWLINRHPAWRCDFHTDINIQMNYWFTSASNLTDCFAPFAHWVDSIREVRKEETRNVLGVEHGWLMRSENGIFGGSTWHIQKGDSAWLCQNLWDHYTFTLDTEYLARYAYPVMKEISEFWVDHLKELPDGTLVAPEGRSPEHGPVGVDGVTYDQQLCWDLFNNTIEAGQILGLDETFCRQLTEKRDRLLAPQIGRWGQLQEWMEDIDDPEDDHRHINHMIGIYPGRRIHPTTTPELARAARVGLVARRDHGQGHPGWSRVWKACIFARLLDGNAAFAQLSETLATHVYSNLWAVHPPFQIDCNFGFSAGVNEMLVQSHLGHIHLLPALPTSWPNGRVTGLRVRGGYELDLDWKDGKLVEATMRGISNPSESIAMQYGESRITMEVPCGETCVFRADAF